MGGCEVHSGMLDTYNSVRTGTIDAILGKLASNPGAALRVTGHSMGSSMAELMCVDLLANRGVHCSQLYTYGTPRTGNQDPIPHLPPASFGYVHATTEMFYN